MGENITIVNYLLDASKFVFRNIGSCFLCSLPFLVVIILLQYFESFQPDFAIEWNVDFYGAYLLPLSVISSALLWHHFTASRTGRKSFSLPVKINSIEKKNMGWTILLLALFILIPQDFVGFLRSIASTFFIFTSKVTNFALPQLLYYVFFIVDQLVLVILAAIALSAGTLYGSDPIGIEEQTP